MELAGPAKARFRYGLMCVWNQVTGMASIPRTEAIFGLGAQYACAGSLRRGSELHTFTSLRMDGQEPFIEQEQYISVESRREIWQENIALQTSFSGPRCIRGDFATSLERFAAAEDTPPIALVNADFMCNIETALPWIKRIFMALSTAWAQPEASRGTLIAINVVGDQPYYRLAWDKKFPPVLETLKAQAWFRSLTAGATRRDAVRLVDDYTYPNKPVGKGGGKMSTVMHTLTFWWGLRRDLSGIRGWLPPVPSDGKRHCGKCREAGHYQSTCKKVG